MPRTSYAISELSRSPVYQFTRADVGTRADLSSGMANMRPLVGARDVNDLTGVFDLSAKANGVSGFLRTVGSLVQRRPQSAVGCKTNY